MVEGGPALHYLDAICAHYPVVFHGVGLSLGSTTPLNATYLHSLDTLIKRYQPAWISDHLSWSGVNGQHTHDLLPLPYTKESITHLSNRIDAIQQQLGQPLLIENASTYFEYQTSELTECDFINAILDRADCLLLLDINNVYVNAYNHDSSPHDFIDRIHSQRVQQLHLAGYADQEHYLLDTHGEPIHKPVWDLYQYALKTLGPVPTLIEWDQNIPDFHILEEEARKAQTYMNKVELNYA
jgi:hypothetical protein